MTDNSNQQRMELYRICVEEEHYFLSEHHKRITFYTGLLSAILTLTIGGFLKATLLYHFVILCLGGLLLIVISIIAKAGTRRVYQRFLETVTTRAKLEVDMGFSKIRGEGEVQVVWVEAEAYSPVRHLKSRSNSKWKSSEEWVENHLEKGKNYHSVSRKMFSVVLYAGIALIIIALVLSYLKCNVDSLLPSP